MLKPFLSSKLRCISKSNMATNIRKLVQQDYNCNFVALMKIKPKYLSGVISQTGAVFLLLIFLSTFLISALHHHEDSHLQVGKLQKEQVKRFYDPCKVCDLIKHQSTDLDYTDVQVFSFTPPLLQIKKAFLVPQAFSSFILKCSNKGPPVLHS